MSTARTQRPHHRVWPKRLPLALSVPATSLSVSYTHLTLPTNREV